VPEPDPGCQRLAGAHDELRQVLVADRLQRLPARDPVDLEHDHVGDQIFSRDRLIDAVDGSVPSRVGRGPARRPVPIQRRPFVKSLRGVPGDD